MTESIESFRDQPPSYRPPALDESAAFRDKVPEGAVDAGPSIGLSQEEKNWAMYCHLAALAGLAFPGVGSIVGPILCWVIKKDQMPFVDRQGKESLNFQLNMLIYILISIPLAIVTFGIGLGLTAALGIYGVVMPILAGLKANEGHDYRYPLTFRLIK